MVSISFFRLTDQQVPMRICVPLIESVSEEVTKTLLNRLALKDLTVLWKNWNQIFTFFVKYGWNDTVLPWSWNKDKPVPVFCNDYFFIEIHTCMCVPVPPSCQRFTKKRARLHSSKFVRLEIKANVCPNFAHS